MADVSARAEAAADMGDIFRFSIGVFGRPTAVEYMMGLDEALARLGSFPEIGRIDRTIDPPVHVCPIGAIGYSTISTAARYRLCAYFITR